MARDQGWYDRCIEGERGLLPGTRQFFETGRTGQDTLVTDPARQKGFGVVADPLVEQGRDLTTNVSGVIQAREFKAL